MFQSCDFLLGQGKSIVIVVPGRLPQAETYTVAVSPGALSFRADYDEIAHIPYKNKEVYERLSYHPQVGVMEFYGKEYPKRLSAVAYIEVRKGVQ